MQERHAGAGQSRTRDARVFVYRAQHNKGGRTKRLQAPARLQPVDTGQQDIEHDDLWPLRAHELQPLLARGRGANEREVSGPAQDVAQRADEDVTVVNDDDS